MLSTFRTPYIKVILVLLLVGIVSGLIFFLSQKNNPKQNPTEKLTDTSSIQTITGQVKSLNDDSFVLQYVDAVTGAAISVPVIVSSGTTISWKPVLANAEASKSGNLEPAVFKDVKENMLVEVTSLNIDQVAKIAALSIILPRRPAVLQGVIQSKASDSFVVHASEVLSERASDGSYLSRNREIYTVNILPNTQIFDISSPEKGPLSIKDLSSGDTVVIYVNSSRVEYSASALKIDLIPKTYLQ